MPTFSPASPEAQAVTEVFTITLAVLGVILAVVTTLVIYAAVRFRDRPGLGEPRQVQGHLGLEVGWTVVPLLIVGFLFGLAVWGVGRSTFVGPLARPDLRIVAHQWWWEVHYPHEGVTTANEIHIPPGKRLRTRI
jgi:cytochrome c oxidase subunit 2